MIKNVITFFVKNNKLLLVSLGLAAVFLYFLILYFLSVLSDKNTMLIISYNNKALAERVALLSVRYVDFNVDLEKHNCINEVLQNDLTLLKSSNKAMACNAKVGGATINNMEEKLQLISQLELIDNVSNYIIHANNLLKEKIITNDNKDFAYLLDKVNEQLGSDIEHLIRLQETELKTSEMYVKTTEKLFALFIWLILLTKIASYIQIPHIAKTEPLIRKILIVEDNRVNSEVISKIVENNNYKSICVTNGQEALEVIDKDRDFCLVFMDCEMPIMDGFEATANIRKNEKEQNLNRIPIIALTANVMDGYKQTCLENGMDDYLAKPITVGALESMIEKWERRSNFDRSMIDNEL